MQRIFLLIAFCAVFSCKNEPDPNLELLKGTWKCSAWLVFDKPSDFDASSVSFEFKNDGNYSATFGSQVEKGTYRLKDNKLYTTGENKIEKMVALGKLTKDSCIMNMNRAGQDEKLILLKK